MHNDSLNYKGRKEALVLSGVRSFGAFVVFGLGAHALAQADQALRR